MIRQEKWETSAVYFTSMPKDMANHTRTSSIHGFMSRGSMIIHLRKRMNGANFSIGCASDLSPTVVPTCTFSSGGKRQTAPRQTFCHCFQHWLCFCLITYTCNMVWARNDSPLPHFHPIYLSSSLPAAVRTSFVVSREYSYFALIFPRRYQAWIEIDLGLNIPGKNYSTYLPAKGQEHLAAPPLPECISGR